MAGQWIGVNGVARKIKNQNMGIGGVARKIKNGFIGINGAARRFFSSSFDIWNGAEGNKYGWFCWNPGTFDRGSVGATLHQNANYIGYDFYGNGATDRLNASPFYSGQLIGITSLDNFSNIEFDIDTYGKSMYLNNMYMAISFKSGNNKYSTTTKLGFSLNNKDNTSGRHIIKYAGIITDDIKTKFKNYYALYGAPYCHIQAYTNNSEGEDYNEYEWDKIDIYRISFT